MSLLEGIRKELEELNVSEKEIFIDAFNNKEEYQRVRNRKPRTDLMVKGLEKNGKTRYSENGFIAQSLLRSINGNEENSYISYERFIDIGIREGNWWEGTMYWHHIVEIENDIAEFKGTLNDLFIIQSENKYAVF